MAESSKKNPENILNFKLIENRIYPNLDDSISLNLNPKPVTMWIEALFNGNAGVVKEALESAIKRIKVLGENLGTYLPDFLEVGYEGMQKKPAEIRTQVEGSIKSIRMELVRSILGPKLESYNFTQPIVPIHVSYSPCSVFLQKLKELIFMFKITQLSTFRLAMETLCDVDFNSSGIGLLRITENGVKFWVSNSRTRVSSFLWLNSADMQEFQYFKSEDTAMWVDLKSVLEVIIEAESSNAESITIFSIKGSNKISFNFGSQSMKELDFGFYEHKPILAEVQQIPDIAYNREVLIGIESLREIVKTLELLRNHPVSVNIKEQIMRIKIGEITWEVEVPLGHDHKAQLVLFHLNMWKKASKIAPHVLLRFPADMRNMIVTMFEVPKFGVMKFITETMN